MRLANLKLKGAGANTGPPFFCPQLTPARISRAGPAVAVAPLYGLKRIVLPRRRGA